MPYLIAIGALVIISFVIYWAGRRAGYEAGRVDERKEWSARLRELDE